jgi:hypothetical protein
MRKLDTVPRCGRVMRWPRRSRDGRDGGRSGGGRSWAGRQERGLGQQVSSRFVQRDTHECGAAVLMYAARAGAVSCSVVSCRIRPASTAVEQERERERRCWGCNGREGDAVYTRRVMRRCIWCRLGYLDPEPGTVPGTRASSGGVLVW